MKRISFAVLTILLSTAQASFENKGNGAANIGLSLSGIASHYPEFSVFNNPSLISGKPLIDLYYRNHYGIKELNQIAIASEFALFNQPMGMGLMRYGNNNYSETELTWAVAVQPEATFALGLSISMFYLQIKDYGNAFSLGLHFALFFQMGEHIRLAGIINNLNEPEIGSVSEKIPVSAVWGLSYTPLRQVEILIDSYKEEFQPFAYRLGTRIQIIHGINFLAGLQNNINSFSFGLELEQNSYAIKYSVDIHPVLNASHALGFRYVL